MIYIISHVVYLKSQAGPYDSLQCSQAVSCFGRRKTMNKFLALVSHASFTDSTDIDPTPVFIGIDKAPSLSSCLPDRCQISSTPGLTWDKLQYNISVNGFLTGIISRKG